MYMVTVKYRSKMLHLVVAGEAKVPEGRISQYKHEAVRALELMYAS